MIDPQTQGNKWIRKKEAQNDLKVMPSPAAHAVLRHLKHGDLIYRM